MNVRLLLFARAKDVMHTDSLVIELPAPATVGELRRRLSGAFPQLAALVPRSAFAVDEEFADDAVVIRPEATVALIPPVSGG
jgi:molybdopterin converting factor subunit 1